MKTWPSDAVMVVCSAPEEANMANMDSVNPGVCRDCGRAVVYDGYTMRRCLALPERCGRPVKLFCCDCAVRYDVNSIDLLEDHRAKAEGRS